MHRKNGSKETSKLKKTILIMIALIALVAILSLLQYAVHYYSNPAEKDIDITTTGCLLFKDDKRQQKNVLVEIKGKILHYIFHNEEDAVQGDIYVNGFSIFGNGRSRDENNFGFYTRFLENSGYAAAETPGDNNLCKIITVSKNLNTAVCVVDGDAAITGEIDSSPIEALLVIPADNLDNAESLVKEAVSNSQQFKSWLMDNNWITGLE